MEKNSDVAFIFKRSFLGIFWGLIFVPLFIAYFWFKGSSPDALAAQGIGVENPYVIGGIAIYGVIGAIYAFVTGHTKHVERVIRLMSDKNGEKMNSRRSLLLSRKAFKAAAKFRIALFFRYYSTVALAYAAVSCYAFAELWRLAFGDEASPLRAGISFAAVVVVILIGWVYAHFFLAAKTRFAWFVYLSHYGEGLSNASLFDEVRKLNDVDSGDDRSAIAGYLKRDMAADAGAFLSGSAVDAAAEGLMPDVAKGYAGGAAHDASEYSKMKLNYDQYEAAYQKAHGRSPELSRRLLEL